MEQTTNTAKKFIESEKPAGAKESILSPLLRTRPLLQPSHILVIFCLLGALLGLLPQLILATREETAITSPIEHTDFQTIVWKVRRSFDPGERVRISAQHRFAGAQGRFRFVVYQGLAENFKRPDFEQQSPFFEVSEPGQWSSWEFNTGNSIIFVGLEWEGQQREAPVALERSEWRNALSFNNYAYTGHAEGKVDKKEVPIRANLRLEQPLINFSAAKTQLTPSNTWLTVTSVAFLVLAALLILMKAPLSTMNLIGFSVGVVFAYRAWAWFGPAAAWTWGSSYISFLPLEVRIVLFAAGPILVFSLLGKRIFPVIITKKSTPWLIGIGLIALAWLFRGNRVYGDWVYGYTNHTHAPFSASVYAALESLSESFEWFHQHQKQLISVLVFAPFLFLLKKLVADQNIRGLNLAPAMMLISASSLQCFFGYVEVYSVPMFFWMAFAVATFGFLDRKWPVWVPTAVAFVAYISHVSEAMLLFPLLYLWYFEIRYNRPGFSRLAIRVASLAVFALTFTALSYALLFVFKYHSDLAVYTKDFSLYGFEILAGQHHHQGVSLPLVTSQLMSGSYTPPGPDYAIFSLENLMKIIGFQFHYSMMFFLLPLLILARERFRPMQDPKIAFTMIALVTYTVYASFAYVGWLPIIRDWDLFAIYSMIGGTLTFLLLRRESTQEGFWAIAALNLLQTLPWILMNHFQMQLPW